MVPMTDQLSDPIEIQRLKAAREAGIQSIGSLSVHLSLVNGDMRVTELVEITGLNYNSITTLVRSSEAGGRLRSYRGLSDKRERLGSLTPLGLDAVKAWVES